MFFNRLSSFSSSLAGAILEASMVVEVGILVNAGGGVGGGVSFGRDGGGGCVGFGGGCIISSPQFSLSIGYLAFMLLVLRLVPKLT